MRKLRILMFFIMIALGAVAGLIYGWIIDPVKVSNTSPDLLRADYKADYVLMVAQIYRDDGDLNQAEERLRVLGNRPPLKITAEGMETALALGYVAEDLEAMEGLYQALLGVSPTNTPGDPP